jgi:hypothetical protein
VAVVGFAILVIVAGLWFLVSAVLDLEWFYGIADFSAAESLLGERAARWLCGGLGLVLIALGAVALSRVL